MNIPFAETFGRVFSRRHVRLEAFPWGALCLAGIMLATGLVFISAMDASPSNTGPRRIHFDGHKEKLIVAIPIFFAGLFLRPQWLRRNTPLIYGACIALLALVPFIGDERNNARRWIQLPKFDLQPSELAKVGLILMLARVLHRNELKSPGEWIAPLFVAALPMGLVAMQPDLGTALTMVPVTLGLIYLAGGSGLAIVGLIAGAALMGAGAFQGGLIQTYQLERIETWVESFDTEDLIASRNGPGFHTFHARAFTGNGGMYGRGLGEGVANETGLLPERDCDSIIAVIAEEGGFAWTSILLLGYALMIGLLMLSASRLRDRFARLAVGAWRSTSERTS